MKLFRRFLMVLLPLLLIGAVFLFFPELRPDTSEYRELRKADFVQGIEISKKGGKKEILGHFNDVYVRGFQAFDVGKLRIAFRDESVSRGGLFYMGYSGSGLGYNQDPLLIDPPRKVKTPPPPSPSTPSVSPGVVPPGAVPTTPTPLTSKLPGGTRLEILGTTFNFEDGKVVIDGETFSTIEKPMLIVLREDFTIELAEDLKPGTMPADVIVP